MRRLVLCSAVVVAATSLVVAAAACVPSTSIPATCNDPTVSFSATLTATAMQPDRFEVCRDQEVTITVAAQVGGEVHFHGYDDEIGEKEITAGQTLTVTFKAAHPGQFPIELHPEDGSAEREVAALVVNEP
ncbi:MAG TPA: hypothetical protein VF153_01230 [Candidatus Limnocylindria bacterium]